jgi:hypothetical protein
MESHVGSFLAFLQNWQQLAPLLEQLTPGVVVAASLFSTPDRILQVSFGLSCLYFVERILKPTFGAAGLVLKERILRLRPQATERDTGPAKSPSERQVEQEPSEQRPDTGDLEPAGTG